MFRNPGTNREGRSFNALQIEAVWRKAETVWGQDPNLWRKDPCGALTYRALHGDTSSRYGWEVDHIYPVAHGGGDDLNNLQALQWQNNRSKSDKLFGSYCMVGS